MMMRSLQEARAQRHGKVAAAAATHQGAGLDIDDALYHLAHDYPGGVPALAQRMGMSPNSLAHKVSLTQRTHHASPGELVKLQAIAGDARPLHAMAAELGYVAIAVTPKAGGGTSLQDVTRLVREFAELLGAVTEAAEDASITANEMRRVEAEAGDVMAAIDGCLMTLRAMMPPAPEAAA